MKRYISLMLFLLSAAFTLPIVAQQASDQGSTSSPSIVEERQPIPPPDNKGYWDGDEPNLVNLVTHPFASKKYVQRHVGPIRDRLSELDQITSDNSSHIKDVDARASQSIQLASEKVNLADQHAADAGTKAQAAQTSATEATTRVSSVEQMVGNIDQYKDGGQTEIRFRPGQTVLSKAAKDALDQMASQVKDQRSYIIEVRGFAPGHGQAAMASSRKMADSVVRYLVLSHQIPVYRIYAMSMGNPASVSGGGTAAKQTSGGRVEVSVLKNDLAASTSH